jgi:putative ABC transport system permease protein
MNTLWHDLRYGIRMLFKRPGFTAMAILTLALGIGLNAAIFSIYNTVILRPLPVRDPSRVVNLYSAIRGERQTNSFSYPEYVYYRDNNSIFSGLAAYAGGKVLLGGPDASSAQAAQPEWLHTQLVSGNYFDLLGASPALGRTFLPEEDKTPATHPVVVLSYPFWQSRLGADPAIIGRSLNLNSLPYTVIGIAPKGFIGTDPDVPDAWIPVMMSANVHSGPSLLDDREAGWVSVVGRLKPGVTLRQSQAEMEVLAGRFHVADKDRQRQSTVVVTPSGFLSPSQQSDVVPFAVLIMVAVGLVLLIACANVANLQLVRGVSRQKEMGIRLSLGASRGRLIRQLLAESLLLSAIAGVAGLFVGWWAASLFVSFMHPPGEKALSLQIALDWRVAAYLAGTSLLAGLVTGLMPALRASRQDPLHAIREQSADSSFRSGSKLRAILVASQVAISLFLLVGAGLLVRALGKARNVDPGFNLNQVAVLSPDLRVRGYGKARATEFDEQLVQRAATLPGVVSVALGRTAPLGNSFAETGIMAQGHETPAGQQSPGVNFNIISPGFFDTIGIPLLHGRSFTAAEVTNGSHLAVVSKSLAQMLWPGENAVGKYLRQGRKSPLYEVVGVVGDVRNVYLWASNLPYLYLPPLAENQDNFSDMQVFVRTKGNPVAAISALPGIARSIDSTVPATSHSLADNLAKWVWPSQIGAALSTGLGLLALLLAAVGITSVTAFAVSQRTREIGIRMALGADPNKVVRLFVWQASRLVLCGAAVGLALAAAASRVLARFLYGLSAVDGIAFIGVTLLLTGVALAACWIPARRATMVDPMVALRHE